MYRSFIPALGFGQNFNIPRSLLINADLLYKDPSFTNRGNVIPPTLINSKLVNLYNSQMTSDHNFTERKGSFVSSLIGARYCRDSTDICTYSHLHESPASHLIHIGDPHLRAYFTYISSSGNTVHALSKDSQKFLLGRGLDEMFCDDVESEQIPYLIRVKTYLRLASAVARLNYKQ